MILQKVNTITKFQSTPSTRRETNDLAESEHDNEISIHSLHTEGDAELTAMAAEASQNFNPLPPHGGRQQKIQQIKIQLTFQSTPSTRRETHSMAISAWFSIFQSTPSTRRETRGQHHSDGNISFQSTPSTRRETPELLPALHIFPHFNPLPPHGGRHWAGGYIEDQNGISIHSLHTEGDC